MTNNTTGQTDACPDCPEWRKDMCWMCEKLPTTPTPTPTPIPETPTVPIDGPIPPPTGNEVPAFLAEFFARESPLGGPLSPDTIDRLHTLLEQNGLSALATELNQRRPLMEERYLLHQTVVTIAGDIERFEALNLQQVADYSRTQLEYFQQVDQLQINKINLPTEQLAVNSVSQ